MNPATKKNPLDGAKYREQYLSNLRLQASNDQRNQNANAIFKQTGQTPSRPPDMRTTTEKAMDIEGMKVDLRSKLAQITEGNIASQIIGELNADQIRFAIDKWETISADMAKQFSRGVPTSAFIAYLNRLISKFQQTEGVETGLQQSVGEAIIMSNTQILLGLPRGQIWRVLTGQLDKVSRQFGINVRPILDSVEDNQSIIPSAEEMRTIQALPPNKRAEINTLANDIYRNLPSNNVIADLIADLNTGLANRDKRYTEGILNELVQQIQIEPSVLDQMANIRGIVSDYFNETQADNQLENAIDDEEDEELQTNPMNPPSRTFEDIVGDIGTPSASAPSATRANIPKHITGEEWSAMGTRRKGEKVLFLNERLRKNPDYIFTDDKGKEYGLGITRRGFKLFDSEKSSNPALNNAYADYLEQSFMGSTGEGMGRPNTKTGGVRMTGMGLNQRPKINKPYRQSIAHLVDKPIEKPRPYTQFGRYYINKHRLEGEGIAAFRCPSGNTIPLLRSEKLSPKLGSVMRILVGKGIPSYEDIAELTSEDKEKMRHICKTCRVDSPAIPKMKGEGQQEEDRFNILRGEIIAGNDNAKIAKEFKVMLMKFMNEGRIPRRQANEILQELLALGH